MLIPARRPTHPPFVYPVAMSRTIRMPRVKLLAFSPLVLLAACAGPLNNEIGIGNTGRVDGRGVWSPPTLTAKLLPTPQEGLEPSTDARSAPVFGAAGPVAAKDAAPSITGIDRNWSETPVIVPNDLPAHQPRMTWSYLASDTPRARGQYPTAQSALALGSERHNNEQVKEALVAPFVAAGDVVLAIPRFIASHRIDRPTRTSAWPYERMPRREALTTDPISAEAPKPPAATPAAEVPASNAPASNAPAPNAPAKTDR